MKNAYASTDRVHLLDLDGPAALELFNRNYPALASLIDDYQSFPSDTLDHYHVFLFLKDVWPLASRSHLAIILGSDPFREAISWIRWKNGSKYPHILVRNEPAPLDCLKPFHSCDCPAEWTLENEDLATGAITTTTRKLRMCHHLRDLQGGGRTEQILKEFCERL